MRKKLLTKHCALLLLALFATWSTQAWADVTINVKAPSAPHMYVWNSSQTPLNGNWPGDVVTDTKVVNGETYYTKTISNENTVSVIFANDNNEQTGDFTGLTGEVFFHYNGGSLAYGNLPDDVAYESSGYFAYFVNTKNWNDVYAYIYDSNDNSYRAWPGTQMSNLHVDGGNQSVYKFGPITDCNITPAKIIFTNYSGKQTADLDFTNGGYYVYSEYDNGNQNRTDLVAVIDNSRITNTATYFSDAHFREGITKSLGVAEGAAFSPTDYTILDLSYDSESMTGKISNLSGIEHFTDLEELNISNNSIPYGDITALTKLKKIVAIGNPELQGFGVNPPSTSNKILRISSSSVLEYVDVSNTAAYYLTALNNNCGSTLKTLIAANNPTFDYGTFTGCSVLEYLDFSNCGLTRDALSKTHFEGAGGANLKYIDVSNNSRLYYLYVSDKTGLETIIMKNCTAYDYGSFDNCPNLKHADFSGCTALASDMWNHLKPEVHTHLKYLNLSNGTTNVNGHTFSFPALDTLIINNHGTTLTQLNINTHCPSIIDITNDTHLATLAINNCGLTTLPTITATGATSLYKLDLTNNAFTNVPTTGISSLTTLVMNNNQLRNLNVSESNIQYLYAQNNNFGSGEYTLPTTSLVGLDIGNNGFTKFKAENNTSLKSLALAGNTGLTEIELHGNTALTQTSPDGVIENDNGLYIKGLSSLQTLNIENSSFNKLGQQNSLEGVTGLSKLQARNNKFTTFTNSAYDIVANGKNYRPKDQTESSLEHLTGLEYLDLAYNELRDSVHLYRNVNLKHLDVSHNRTIHGVYDGTITTDAQKQAMLEKKAYHFMKYGNVYQTLGENPTATDWTNGYTNFQSKRSRPFDLRTEDLNDTTGLYHLDLGQNVNLEWLDFSYTNIHNTAAGPEYMNPGWIDRDWVTDFGIWEARPSVNTTTTRVHSTWHTFVYFIPCSKLKTIHADHNNMRSMGIRYFPELDTLTCSYMYGDCALMRDFESSSLSSGTQAISDEDLKYGMGNTGLSTQVQRLKSVTWGTDATTGDPKANLTFEGPDASHTYFQNPLKYWDISYSGFNEIRLYKTTGYDDLPNLEYVNVSGNPLNCQVHPNSSVSNYNSLDVTYCPNIRTVKAENCSDLPIVRAHNRTKLDTLYLSNDPKLKALYVQNDPSLKTNFVGLNTLTGLETLFAYNNTHWGNDITFAGNTALKNLWISNIGASQLNVANNAALEKLRAYDNSLTSIDLSHNGELLWLDVARNMLSSIDLSGNTKLQFFNISNGSDTRTQLNGSEALNHDGSDGDNLKPTTVYSANETPISSPEDGNSLSDLALPASIIDARANGNDLHSITGTFANLTNIEFAHNHVNGINLSAAPNATVDSRDNGRTIVADFATFKKKDNNNVVQEYKFYFFQLEEPEQFNGTVLTDKESKDIKLTPRHLGDDGLALDKIASWDSENSGMLKSGTTITPDNMGTLLDPDQIPGNIVVLVPEDVNENTNEASGRATYTYTTGASSVEDQNGSKSQKGSKFYLDWTSNGITTGINIVDMPLDEVTITNTQGYLMVNGADGTPVGVYDLNGRQVASETISGGSVTITGLTAGIYMVNGQKVLVK